MTIYYFNEDGRFTGEGTSAICPKDGATTIVPSSNEDVWNGIKWIAPPPLSQEQLDVIAKNEDEIKIENQIKKMTIKTKSGKTFHADYQARINMMSGVMSAEFANKTETTWKLYDKDENGENIETMVTLDELKEATYLALEK
ncbi:hypothetical protein, partial [Sulfurimonas sp.]|uniref:hypothetical protein n=1 Tax=Sulfurimonas sp. TaxID=2022749 RepID=UPI0025EF22EC